MLWKAVARQRFARFNPPTSQCRVNKRGERIQTTWFEAGKDPLHTWGGLGTFVCPIGGTYLFEHFQYIKGPARYSTSLAIVLRVTSSKSAQRSTTLFNSGHSVGFGVNFWLVGGFSRVFGPVSSPSTPTTKTPKNYGFLESFLHLGTNSTTTRITDSNFLRVTEQNQS